MSELNPLVRTIFNEAVEIADARQRSEFLAAACGANMILRWQIDGLVEAHAAAGNFMGGEGDTLGKTARDVPSPAISSGKSSLPALRRFGDYELGEALGRGGMGVV